MGVKTIDNYSDTTQDTTLGPSVSLWQDFPAGLTYEEPRFGNHFYDTFLMLGNQVVSSNIGLIGQWGAFVGNNGIITTDPAQEGGVLELNAGTTSGVSITMASLAGAFRMLIGSTPVALAKKLWFECRVAIGSIATGTRDAFIGLCDNTGGDIAGAADTVINSSSNTLNTTPNLFGFHFRNTTNITDVGLAYNIAAGTPVYPTGLQTLSNTVVGSPLTAYTAGSSGALATGFIKLGFKLDPDADFRFITTATQLQTAGTRRKRTIKVYVNGQIAPTFLNATDDVLTATFPTGTMSPVIAFKSRTTTGAMTFYIDWIRVGAYMSDQW